MLHNLEEKMFYRIIRVLRIFVYIPYPIILMIGLFDCQDYHFATNDYTWNIKNALLWFCLFSLAYVGIIEGLYHAIFYILFGKKK